ncbi:MAG: hypothetical protein HC905_26235, partial [Bacteroidales bacterium]|nr:hypothetical protein [Bacteroidales bacterium]
NNHYKWAKGKEIVSKVFDTSVDKKFKIDDIQNWEVGKYLLQISGKDKYGEEVKEVAYFDVTDNQKGTMTFPAVFQVTELKSSGEPGEKAVISAGSTEKVKYLFEVEHDGKIVEKQWKDIQNQVTLHEIPIREEYRGNFAVHMVTVKHNRMYANTRVITVPYTNKQLDIRFESFRVKLQPGQLEQWKLKYPPKMLIKRWPKWWLPFTMHRWMPFALITGMQFL